MRSPWQQMQQHSTVKMLPNMSQVFQEYASHPTSNPIPKKLELIVLSLLLPKAKAKLQGPVILIGESPLGPFQSREARSIAIASFDVHQHR